MRLCVQKMDLRAHALIEASAGTGKTYTIEEIFCRLLLGNSEVPGIDPCDILVLTFTEKATAELKQRILLRLSRELSTIEPDNSRAERIKMAIDSFGEAPIQTIHGFCFAVLSDFGFEASQPLEMETIGDRPILEMLLGKILRGSFLRRYRQVMKEVLTVLEFGKRPSDYSGGFRDGLLSLVSRIDFRHDEIYGFETKENDIDDFVPLSQVGLFDTDFFHAAKQVKINLSGRNKKHTAFIEWLVLSANDPTRYSLCEIYRELSALETSAALKNGDSGQEKTRARGADSFARLIVNAGDKIKEEYKEYFLQPLYKLESFMEELKKDAMNFLLRELMVNLFNFKRDGGYLSYDDMLNLVRDAVCNSGESILRQVLFQRYQAVLIDEFQDTDQVQWDIFKTIFLNSDNCRSPVKPLFLIGDPKQAIYSFRRADIYTYFAAADKLKELAEQAMAGVYSLPDNYRSTRELLDIFNAIFSRTADGGWFSPPLSYEGVSYPDKPSETQLKSESLLSDDAFAQGLSALSVFRINGDKRSLQAKMQYAKFISSEIKRLLAMVSEKDGSSIFSPGDFCILVRSRSYASYVETALQEAGLPYSYYKKPNIFASDVSSQLEALLMAVAEPGNIFLWRRALLSHFFNFPLTAVQSGEGPELQATRELFRYWHKSLECGRTGEFFRSVLKDSNFLYNARKGDKEQLIATHQRIVEILLDSCKSRRPTAGELVETLVFLRRHGAQKDDALTHPVADGSGERIQLMTMHVSKGLQFPVVFVFGDFTRSNKGPDYYRFHKKYDDRYRVVWDFDKIEPENRSAHLAEEEAENQRLYYVALTRAERFLYLPYYQYALKHYRGFCAVLSERLEQCCEPDSGLDVRWLDGDEWENSFSSEQSCAAMFPEGPPALLTSPEKELLSDASDGQRRLSDSILKLRSFSGLSRLQKQVTQGFSLNPLFPQLSPAEDENTELEVESVIRLLPVKTRTVEELPGGVETGNMIHELFEKADWAVVCSDNYDAPFLQQQTDELFRRYGVAEPVLRQEALRLVKNTLLAPLPQLNGHRLFNIPVQERFHELDFIFNPFFGKNDKSPHFDLLRGAVDIVFRCQGRYYIGDWKTNTLTDYSLSGLHEAMKAGNYILQADIYEQAVCAWLRTRGLNPAGCFGGVFYFFVRGIDDSGAGIWYRAGGNADFPYSQK